MQCSFYFCSPSLDITKNKWLNYTCIGSWKTTKIFPSSKLCKQRHRGGGGGTERKRKQKWRVQENFKKKKLRKRRSQGRAWSVYSTSWFPVAHCSLETSGSRKQARWKKRIKKFYKHLANQCVRPTHIPALILGKCWQLPLVWCLRILGASSRTWGLMGKMETESQLASQPQNTTTNPHQFPKTGLLWWLLAHKAQLQKWNVPNVLYTHNILSFIYSLGWKNILCLLVSFCQERKAGLASRKPGRLSFFLRVTLERKGKVRSAVWLGCITLLLSCALSTCFQGRTLLEMKVGHQAVKGAGDLTEDNEMRELG